MKYIIAIAIALAVFTSLAQAQNDANQAAQSEPEAQPSPSFKELNAKDSSDSKLQPSGESPRKSEISQRPLRFERPSQKELLGKQPEETQVDKDNSENIPPRRPVYFGLSPDFFKHYII